MHARRGGLALRLMRQGHLFVRTKRNEAHERDARVDVCGRTRVPPRGGSTLASTNARACVSRSEPSRVCGSGAGVAKRGRLPLVSVGPRKRAVAAIYRCFCGRREASGSPACRLAAKEKNPTVRDLLAPKHTVVSGSASRARAVRDGGRRRGCPAPSAGQEGAGEAGESEGRSAEDRGRCAFGEGEARAIVREGEPFFLGRSEARAAETREGRR